MRHRNLDAFEHSVDRLRKLTAKCREHGRTKFRIFEADYLPTKGKMVVSELTLLKFKNP